MQKRGSVQGSRTLMPTVVEILQKNNGVLSNTQVVYMVMFKFNYPYGSFKKAKSETDFSAVYLRKLGIMKSDSKKGIWELNVEYMNLSFDEMKKIAYDKYDVNLGRK